MTIGQLYFLNEEECFFKIRLQKNHQELYISLVKDIARERNHEYNVFVNEDIVLKDYCLLYTSPSPRDATLSRMPSSA